MPGVIAIILPKNRNNVKKDVQGVLTLRWCRLTSKIKIFLGRSKSNENFLIYFLNPRDTKETLFKN